MMGAFDLKQALEKMTIVRHAGKDAIVVHICISGPPVGVSELELYAFDDESRATGKRVKAIARDVTPKEVA